MLQSQFKNVQFSFLFFFNLCSDVLSILLKMSVLSFFFLFFLYAVYNNVQVSSLSFFSRLFLLSCTFLFSFSFSFFFFHFFFHNKLLIQCPLFFSTLYLPLCLYLNMIPKGSPPSLFNFSLQYHKLSLIYNTTFSIAYEHSSFFFFLQNIPV